MILRDSASVPREQLFTISNGARGTRETLRLMSRLVRQWKTDSRMRAVASDLVFNCAQHDYRSEAMALWEHVSGNIRYMMDVNGVETIQAPDVTLLTQSGDCDDKATLLATLLESIGHPARFIAVGFTTPGEFEHVYVETRIGNVWIACETTVPEIEFGWSPLDERRAVAYMRENI